MLQSMAGRTVIVTGGSKGIGRGLARRFGAAGLNVLVVSRNLAEAQSAARDIGQNAWHKSTGPSPKVRVIPTSLSGCECNAWVSCNGLWCHAAHSKQGICSAGAEGNCRCCGLSSAKASVATIVELPAAMVGECD